MHTTITELDPANHAWGTIIIAIGLSLSMRVGHWVDLIEAARKVRKFKAAAPPVDPS